MENIEIINGFKKKDDWLGILQFYDLQAMDRDIPADTSIKEQNEILFAAKHWCDDMQRRANSKPLAEQALRGYIWTYTQSEKLLANNPDNLSLLKNYAYDQYEIFLQLGYNLNKMCRKYKIDQLLQKKVAYYRKTCYDNTIKAQEKILEITPNDIKWNYRYGKTISKQLSQEGYKDSKAINIRNYKTSLGAYQKAISLYEGAENKKPIFKEYIKSLYGLACLINDETTKSFYPVQLLSKIITGEKTYVFPTSRQGIAWTLKDLKLAQNYSDKVFQELKLPNDVAFEDVKIIVGRKEPIILPFYLYYRRAKIFYMMGICYSSGLSEMYNFKNKYPEKANAKMYNYFELARKNCEYALDIRLERISLGEKDSGGIYPEASLLATIYTILDGYRVPKIEELIKKCPRDKNLKYHYAVACVLLQNGNSEKGRSILNELAKEKSPVGKQAVNTIAEFNKMF